MYYSDNFVQEVSSRNDIVDIVSGYVRLKKKGNSYFGLCPFHNEKSPSFSVSGDKQMFYCFGCGEGGNVFSFIQKIEMCSFPEAVEYLANKAGLEVEKGVADPSKVREYQKKDRILEANKEAAIFMVKCLRNEMLGKAAREYIANRGLTEETVRSFGIGYCPTDSELVYKHLRSMGFEDDILRETGLFHFSERGVLCNLYNRVIFPIMDINGKVIGFGGRVMGKGEPKYLNTPETKVFEKRKNLFGMNYAKKSKRGYLLLCEGYMDVISLHQAGYTNAVASLGTAFTPDQARMIKRYVNDVYITYDSDGAGRKAALRAIPILLQREITSKVINMKPHKDPDEFIKALGGEEYEKRIEKAQSAVMYQIDCAREGLDLSNPDDKAKFNVKVSFCLANLEDMIRIEPYIKVVSKEYDISEETLKNSVITALKQVMREKEIEEGNREQQTGEDKKKKEDSKDTSQKMLITWIVDNPTYAEKVFDILDEKDFIDPMFNKVFVLVRNQILSGSLNPSSIINEFDEEQSSVIASIFNKPIMENMTLQEQEKAINELVMRIKRDSLNYQKSNTTDMLKLVELAKELSNIKKIHIHL